jgi:hypothetical protein
MEHGLDPQSVRRTAPDRGKAAAGERGGLLLIAQARGCWGKRRAIPGAESHPIPSVKSGFIWLLWAA